MGKEKDTWEGVTPSHTPGRVWELAGAREVEMSAGSFSLDWSAQDIAQKEDGEGPRRWQPGC